MICVEFMSTNNLPDSESYDVFNTTICLFRLNIHMLMSLTHFLLKHLSAYNSFDVQEHKPNM